MFKRFFIFSLILAIFLTITGSSFDFTPGQAKTPQIDQSNNQPKSTGQTIVVTQASLASSGILVELVDSSTISTSCAWPNFAIQTLVQDQGQINFNQPANCFRVSSATPLTQNDLQVIQFSSASQVTVVPPSDAASLARDSVLPGPASSRMPQTLPLAAASILTIVAVGSVRRKMAAALSSIQNHNPLSLPELCMMRC